MIQKRILIKILHSLIFVVFSTALKAQTNDNSSKIEEIKAHNKTVYLMEDVWMRDPFIQLAPDGFYYLSCTRQNSNLGLEAPKGGIEVYKSSDLVSWQSLGVIWNTSQSVWGLEMQKRAVSLENKHDIKEAMIFQAKP